MCGDGSGGGSSGGISCRGPNTCLSARGEILPPPAAGGATRGDPFLFSPLGHSREARAATRCRAIGPPRPSTNNARLFRPIPSQPPGGSQLFRRGYLFPRPDALPRNETRLPPPRLLRWRSYDRPCHPTFPRRPHVTHAGQPRDSDRPRPSSFGARNVNVRRPKGLAASSSREAFPIGWLRNLGPASGIDCVRRGRRGRHAVPLMTGESEFEGTARRRGSN